jgi:predicted nucleic acid-binding protein
VIVLDTNVISSLMQDEPDRTITGWLDSISSEPVWTTAITFFELRYGIERLASGRRRRRLESEFARVIDDDLENRILAFDEKAASVAGMIAASRRRRGRPTEIRDTFIAGIVVSNNAEFATGNVRHFQDLEIRVIDPWSK